MRFKTDENVPALVAALLVAAGHDAMRIDEQGMSGFADHQVAAVCADEARAIVTLDLHFSNVRNFPPENYAGIIVLRPSSQTLPVLRRLIGLVIPLLDEQPLIEHLWVVDDTRVRVRRGAGS